MRFVSIRLTESDEKYDFPEPQYMCKYCGYLISPADEENCPSKEYVLKNYTNLIDGRVTPGT